MYEEEGDSLVDTHGEYIHSPRNVAHEMHVPFIDMAKLTYDLVTAMGPEKSKELFLWIPAGKYSCYPQEKTDNTHLSIYGSKLVAKIAAEALAKTVPKLAKYLRPCTDNIPSLYPEQHF